MKIQDILSTIIASVPGAPFPGTVDTVKTGDPSQECSGIVVTFLATVEVIERAAALGANLIITHEPTFYNHTDDAEWTRNNSAVVAKHALLEKYNMVVWRFHDYLHTIDPDPTVMGLIHELGFDSYRDAERLFCVNVPPITVRDLVALVKTKLDITTLRIIGDFDVTCETIAFLPGIPPTEMQIGIFDQQGVDVLICGEINEWETSEYARDAQRLGSKKVLFVIGHAASEELGMRRITHWLQERIPDQTITFVPTTPFFQTA